MAGPSEPDRSFVLEGARIESSAPSELPPAASVHAAARQDSILRQRAEAELRTSESRYRALVQAIPDVILRVSKAGMVLDTQSKALAGSPYDPQKYIGKHLESFGPPEVVPGLLRAIELSLITRAVQTYEYRLRAPKGEYHREARVAPQDADEVVIIIRDVSERVQSQAEAVERMSRIEMLDAISQAFAGVTLDYGAALDTAVRRASELIGDICILAELEPDRGELRALAAYDRQSSVRQQLTSLFEQAPLPVQASPLEPVLDLGDSVLLNDISRQQVAALVQAEQQPLVLALGVHGLMSVPMRVLGQVTGALVLARHRTGRRYVVEDLVFAQSIADRAAVAIHCARLYSENLRQAAALKAVNRDLEQRIVERTLELERANELLRHQATEDPLTGLANRRLFATTLDLEIRRARRHSTQLTLLIADVDYFKRYNDCYGHPAGDECLKRVSQVLQSSFRRAGDLVARYGGEEFAVILPVCGPEGAATLCERLRAAIQALGIAHSTSEAADCVTVSVGAVTLPATCETSAEVLIKTADEALYRSKASGRNCTTAVSLELPVSKLPTR